MGDTLIRGVLPYGEDVRLKMINNVWTRIERQGIFENDSVESDCRDK